MFEAQQDTYLSVDTVVDRYQVTDFPVEFLNSLNPTGLLLHKFILKIGALIILIRNLNAPKLCNGTRLQVKSLKKNVIEVKILTGCAKGDIIDIPRIPMITSDYPFEFNRL